MVSFTIKGCDTSTTGADKWGQVPRDKDEAQKMIRLFENDN